MFCILFYVLVLFVEHAFGQPDITLWQFGTDRLPHHGGTTEPLRPVGTASDGLSTTYIYEVLYPTTTSHQRSSGIIPTTTTLSTLRTIIASASGWVEVFDSGNMECNFVDSDNGICSDEKFTGSGHPSPVVLTVQASLTITSSISGGSPSMPADPTRGSDYPSISTTFPKAGSSSTAAIQSSKVGAIVGSTIAVVSAIALFILWRRRRRSRRQELLVEQSNSHQEDVVQTAGGIHPYLVPVQLIRTDGISAQPENWIKSNSMQPRSKRAALENPVAQDTPTLQHRMTAVIDRLINTRLEELGLVSNHPGPPPSYAS